MYLEADIQQYLEHKYETTVWVNKPNQHKQGNTSHGQLVLLKRLHRTRFTTAKIHIDVCAIPF